jgi:hypothetical protein
MTHVAVVRSPSIIVAARFLVFPLLGAAVHALAMAAGYGYDTGYAVSALVALVCSSAVAVWGCVGSPGRLSVTAAVLAGAAVAGLPAWWSGWPVVLGATAAGLALEHRSRYGAWSRLTVTTAVVGGGVAAVAALLCLAG